MVSIPRAFASRGLPMVTAWPFTKICPESGGRAPESVRMSVVLPAPFPPTRPTTSPAKRSIVTPLTARTPPKWTWMLRISTSGTRCATGAGVGVVCVSMIRSTYAPAHECVEAHGHDEHQADDDVLRGRVDEEQHHPRAQRLHDHRAEDRAGHRPDAT